MATAQGIPEHGKREIDPSLAVERRHTVVHRVITCQLVSRSRFLVTGGPTFINTVGGFDRPVVRLTREWVHDDHCKHVMLSHRSVMDGGHRSGGSRGVECC